MRKVESAQVELGATLIGDIRINPKSRDDIPALLLGLQHLYTNDDLREKTFALLEREVNPKARKDTGRPGMDIWCILVLAILKQGLGCDFDRIAELASEHNTVRQMLGHGTFEHKYQVQTVIDNISLLSPKLLSEVSQMLAEAGHKVAGKKAWRNIARAR